MQTLLRDVAVALCALAYSAAILGLAALMVLGAPAVPITASAPPPPPAIESAPRPLPANGKPLPPSARRAPIKVGSVELRDL